MKRLLSLVSYVSKLHYGAKCGIATPLPSLVRMSSSTSSSPCCPPGSWGELAPDASYVLRGVVEKVDDLEIYRVGQGDKCIIWNYDIFGFNSGRSKQLADKMAEKGFLVIMPDYYRGEMLDVSKSTEGLADFLKKQSQWEDVIKKDWEVKIKPYAEKHGARIFGALGTCWGSFVVLELCALDGFKAGVSFHPSHSFVWSLVGADEKSKLEAVKGTKQVFMPAKSDAEACRAGGLGEQVLQNDLRVIEFNDMEHGWTTRGDLSVADVERDVKKAMVEAAEHLVKYVQ